MFVDLYQETVKRFTRSSLSPTSDWERSSFKSRTPTLSDNGRRTSCKSVAPSSTCMLYAVCIFICNCYCALFTFSFHSCFCFGLTIDDYYLEATGRRRSSGKLKTSSRTNVYLLCIYLNIYIFHENYRTCSLAKTHTHTLTHTICHLVICAGGLYMNLCQLLAP